MTVPSSRPSPRMERGILGLFAAAAALIGLAMLVGPVRRVLQTLAGGGTPVDLITSAEVPNAGTPGGPGIVSAGFDSASVVATGLSGGTRALLAAGYGLDGLTIAVCTAAAVWFILLLMWGRSFHRSVRLSFTVAGVALLGGGSIANLLVAAGRAQAAAELNPLAGGVFDADFSFEAMPTYLAIGLLVLSYLFRRGERLQRDTEGLV